MNRERLTHLITVLEDVEAQKRNFDLNHFVANVRHGQVVDYCEKHTSPVIHEPCGTACCALGYAGMDPTFIKQGFRLRFTPLGEDFPVLYDPKVHGDRIRIDTGSPYTTGPVTDENCDPWEATQEFFGIDHETADHLFMSDSYPEDTVVGPRQVIERIQEVLAR